METTHEPLHLDKCSLLRVNLKVLFEVLLLFYEDTLRNVEVMSAQMLNLCVQNSTMSRISKIFNFLSFCRSACAPLIMSEPSTSNLLQ
jgi:hypothetical protein